MQSITTFLLLALLPLLTAGNPIRTLLTRRQESTSPAWPNFLIVTTSSEAPAPAGNASLLPDVSATSLFDPYHQYTWLLRLTGPGYGSLPVFNLTTDADGSDGVLHTTGYTLGVGEEEYNSTEVTAGAELSFDPEPVEDGNIGLWEGYLLTVGGECKGWTVCTGEIGQDVISWKGSDTTCEPVFLQAVQNAPY